jgi:predicted transcriptional regulator
MKMEGLNQDRGDEGLPENIEYLTSSYNRVAVLRSLCQEPGSPSDVRGRLDIPRSTFRRVLSELEERNWAEKEDGVYSATPLGECVESRFSDTISTTRRLDDLEVFFEHVPFEEIEVEFSTVAESRVTTSDSYSPHAPMEKFLEAVRGADRVRGIAPVITDTYAQTYYDEIKQGTEVKNVIQESVAEAILSRYADMFGEVTEMEETETYVYEGEFPLGLAIVDGEVLVSSFDSDGIMRGLVRNDSEEMFEWAEGYFEEYVERSDPLEKFLQ